LIAAQVVWNDVTEFVCLRQAPAGRQIVTVRMKRIDWLAICPGIVGTAVSGRLSALHNPLVEAAIRISC